jgi:hypothetical protein
MDFENSELNHLFTSPNIDNDSYLEKDEFK